MHTGFRGKRVAPRLLLRVALLSPVREERASRQPSPDTVHPLSAHMQQSAALFTGRLAAEC